MQDVRHTPCIVQTDAYSRLLIYLRGVLEKFSNRLAIAKIGFEMFCTDARELTRHLSLSKYARIEVPFVSLKLNCFS